MQWIETNYDNLKKSFQEPKKHDDFYKHLIQYTKQAIVIQKEEKELKSNLKKYLTIGFVVVGSGVTGGSSMLLKKNNQNNETNDLNTDNNDINIDKDDLNTDNNDLDIDKDDLNTDNNDLDIDKDHLNTDNDDQDISNKSK